MEFYRYTRAVRPSAVNAFAPPPRANSTRRRRRPGLDLHEEKYLNARLRRRASGGGLSSRSRERSQLQELPPDGARARARARGCRGGAPVVAPSRVVPAAGTQGPRVLVPPRHAKRTPRHTRILCKSAAARARACSHLIHSYLFDSSLGGPWNVRARPGTGTIRKFDRESLHCKLNSVYALT